MQLRQPKKLVKVTQVFLQCAGSDFSSDSDSNNEWLCADYSNSTKIFHTLVSRMSYNRNSVQAHKFVISGNVINSKHQFLVYAASQLVDNSDFPVLKFKLVGQCSKQLHHCLDLDNLLSDHHHHRHALVFRSSINNACISMHNGNTRTSQLNKITFS